MDWSPAQYTKFEDERNRPIQDLLARIPAAHAATAVDIGCGPGNSTELLCARFPNAIVSGMDNSPNMIADAKKRLPAIQFELADIAAWQNKNCFDVILANASLQWVPNHKKLFPALVKKLNPNGTLAVQMPDNANEPSHRIMREIAADNIWGGKLSGASKAKEPRHSAKWYFKLLKNEVTKVDIWRTVYHHPLADGGGVVEMFKSTGLRPFLNPLDEEEKKNFLARYRVEIDKAYPALPDGSVLLPFPRLFIVATL